MTMFTLTIPFEFTHEYDEETEVQIPIFSPGLRPDHDLSQHAPSARWDPKSGAVRTSLDLASATYVYLTNNHKPEVPSLVDDAADVANRAYRVVDGGEECGRFRRARRFRDRDHHLPWRDGGEAGPPGTRSVCPCDVDGLA